MTRVKFSTSKFLATLLVASIPMLGGGMTPANASTIPSANTQGDSEGVLYYTEQTSGQIRIGDIGSTPTTSQIFWEDAGSKVDQVAVTQTRIAWASKEATSNMRTEVMISNIGDIVGPITSVDVTGGAITSLTADTFGERFYITTSAGDVWRIPSAGGIPTRVITGNAAVAKVLWGSWFDSYNSKFYFCTYDTTMPNPATRGRVYVAPVTGSTMATPAVVSFSGSDVTVEFCDGLGVNPSTQEMFALSAHPTMSPTSPVCLVHWARITAAGVKTNVCNVGAPSNRPSGAPTSTFVSHTTGKLYFASENRVYESNLDGSALRSLYSGSNIQNLAIYYGASISTISNFMNPTVVFDSNGGAEARTFQHGSTSAALTASPFSRSGYTFAGWNTLRNGSGTAYADGATYPFTAYTTLFAQWTLTPPPSAPASVTPPASTTSPAPASLNTPASAASPALAATGIGVTERTLVIGASSVLLALGALLLLIRRRLSL